MVAAVAFVSHHFPVQWSADGYLHTLLTFNGADQLLLYGTYYRWPSFALGVVALTSVILDACLRGKRKESWSIYAMPLQLYALSLLAGLILPIAVLLPGYMAPLSFLTARITSVTAVLACCLLGLTAPQKWRLPCLAVIAVVFFVFLYRDTAELDHMEHQAEQYERILPSGTRVIATIWPFVGSRVSINHLVDRACIGQCFSYGNYEPSSGQFRVRVQSQNPLVLATAADAGDAQNGKYIVRAQDLPIFEIYQCNLNMTALCMSELTVGEKSGSIGLQPSTQDKPAAADQVPVR
jgi:hypothetical protein